MILCAKCILSTIILGIIFVHTEAKQKKRYYGIPCIDAVICAHSKKRVCGLIQKTGEVRWFLDKCDILEFNCEYGTAFKKTSKRFCRHVPRL